MRLSILHAATTAMLLVGGTAIAAAPDSLTAQLAPKLAPILGEGMVQKIVPSAHAGLYEVLTPRGIVYTDKTGSFVSYGPIVDAVTRTNLTEKRVDELSKFSFKDLPLTDAIKTVRGDGSRVMATLEDPNCGFCRKLTHELATLNNVTIYTFLTPVLGPESVATSKAIWCAKDQSSAWTALMTGVAPAPAAPIGPCDTPFERNALIQAKLRVTGTPALLFADNTKQVGYISASEIDARLKK